MPDDGHRTMSSQESKTPVRPALESLAYQPAFDGMRFLGVTAFILGHAGLMTGQQQLIPFGWWMAVDMFFVISGYLITTLLLREWAGNGRISLKAFYIRRASRLYPLIFAVVVISVIQQLTRPDAPSTPSWSSIFSMAFYYSNFQQLAHTPDLFNSWSSLWSLAIEEQFYLLWPICLIVLLGRSFKLVRPLVVVSVLTVAIWTYRSVSWFNTMSAGVGFDEAAEAWRTFYFSTFHRPDGLFIGCATAIVLALPRTRWVRGVILTAHRLRFVAIPVLLVIITQAAVDEHASWQVYWGLALFNLLMATVLIELIEFRESRLARLLSYRPLLWVGRRSYGMYVFHLAILMLLIDGLGISTIPWIFTAIAIVIAVAALSYRYYEDPIRRWGYRFSRRALEADPKPS
jgi:peptidoglycan/LPS O-acetylase OafA/YrhL